MQRAPPALRDRNRDQNGNLRIYLTMLPLACLRRGPLAVLLGHTTVQMTSRYVHPTDATRPRRRKP